MARDYARWSAAPIGDGLLVEDGGLTLRSMPGHGGSASAISSLLHSQGTRGAEFFLWGSEARRATLGVLPSGADLAKEVGATSGVGWRLAAGQILRNGVVLMSGLQVPGANDAVGILVSIGESAAVEFYLGVAMLARVELQFDGGCHFAASLIGDQVGDLRCVVNAGQWQGLSPAQAAGWYAGDGAALQLRLASEDFLSSPSDQPANASYQGVIGAEGLATVASVSFWPWAAASRNGAAQVRVFDSDGSLDAAALSSARNQAVRVRQATVGGTLSDSEAVARYVLDRIEIEDDGAKVLVLRDAHDDLDEPLSQAVFLPSQGEGIAWKPQAVVIGAVRSLPGVAVNSDATQQWLCDSSLSSVSAVMDRGALIAPDTGYVLAPERRQLALASPPVGPVVVDASTEGGMRPATLRSALADVFGRVMKSAWASQDAEAIDASTGYAGIGFYAGDGSTPREALARILPSYAADWWQDGDGTLRLSRLVDPDSRADAALDFLLDWSELAEELAVSPDLAPNLSRRMAYQQNALVLGAGDLISDLVQLPPALRQQLTSPYRGIAYSGGPLAACYAHAETAEPVTSLFDRREDAQTELDRVIALYSKPRRFYAGRITGRTDLQFRPGQIGRITYTRYGLQAGRKVLVTSVLSNRVTGDHTIRFWGA